MGDGRDPMFPVKMGRDPKFPVRLLLDSRGVDVLRFSNLILATLSSLKPFFFNGLKKALPFSANVGA